MEPHQLTPDIQKPVMAPPVKSGIAAPQPAAQPPFDAELFRSRIYVDESTLLTGDHFLAVNKEEVAPANEPRLTAKILKHYSIMEPSFFDYPGRSITSVALASYLSPAFETRKAETVKNLTDLYLEEKGGVHPEDAKQRARYEKPFEAQVKFWQDPNALSDTPISREFKRNALTLYLVLNEGLKARGREMEAAAYEDMPRSPDHALAQLAPRLGISSHEMIDALMKGGVDGFAKLLKVDPATVTEIRQVAEAAEPLEYASNLIENWNIGRAVQGMQTRTVAEKIQVGLLVRTAKTLDGIKAYEFPAREPDDIKAVKDRIVARLRLLPRELQEALYYSGCEIFLTGRQTVEQLYGFPVPALGLHNHAAFMRGQPGGVMQLYAGSMYDPYACDNTLVHEAHHFQQVKSYSLEDVRAIEALITQNSQRMLNLERALAKWEVASPQAKKEIEQQIDTQFTVGGVTLAKALGGEITDEKMRLLRTEVYHAHKMIDPHSESLARGYSSPELRATELISRYSELKFMKHESRPDMLTFIAPQMGEAYEKYYLPHVRGELDKLKQQQSLFPPHMQSMGFPPEAAMPVVLPPVQPGKPGPVQPQPGVGAPAMQAVPHTVAEAAKLPFSGTPTKMVASPGGEALAKQFGKNNSFTQRLDAIESAVESTRSV